MALTAPRHTLRRPAASASDEHRDSPRSHAVDVGGMTEVVVVQAAWNVAVAVLMLRPEPLGNGLEAYATIGIDMRVP